MTACFVVPREFREPTHADRDDLILTLGIISWAVVCPIFGICAWVMGSSDLREMRAGRMDSSAQAGQVIGMIHALVCIIGIMIVFAIILAGVGGR